MSTATHSGKGRVVRPPLEVPNGRTPPTQALAGQLELTAAFIATVIRHLLGVLPQARSELAHWHERAGEIPNPHLRATAREALAKRGNIEGAALFATLAPPARRRGTVRALIAFQMAYNYLDALSELPSEDPLANGDQLHQALLIALHPDAPHVDYYRHNFHSDDGGYLVEIVATCREAVGALPSFQALAPIARAAASRIVDFQTLNLSESQGGHDALQRWAIAATPAGSGLAWWETAAAAGSSLAVHALIAAAAQPGLGERDAREIDGAYFPWIGALHTLLDSLVDRSEDRCKGQHSLLDYYHSSTHAAIQLAFLGMCARNATVRMPKALVHSVILTAMCSYYMSAPESDSAGLQSVMHGLTRTVGLPLRIAIPMFRAKRLLHTLKGDRYT